MLLIWSKSADVATAPGVQGVSASGASYLAQPVPTPVLSKPVVGRQGVGHVVPVAQLAPLVIASPSSMCRLMPAFVGSGLASLLFTGAWAKACMSQSRAPC